MSDNAPADVRIHAFAAIEWTAGASRSAILDALNSEASLQALLERHLPEGVYFSVTDVVVALPEDVARESGLLVISGPGPERGPVASEPFDGITPEGLGAAIRATAGDLAREMEEPSAWFGATVRSAIVPGWGQWHNGEVEKGAAFAAVSLTLGLLSGAPGAASRAVRGKSQSVSPGGVRPFWLGMLAATYVASLLDAARGETKVTG